MIAAQLLLESESGVVQLESEASYLLLEYAADYENGEAVRFLPICGACSVVATIAGAAVSLITLEGAGTLATTVHKMIVGDTLTPLGVQLLQRNTLGALTAVDLTDRTVKFRMVANDGTVIVDDSETGVTIEDAESGRVSYDFQAADVASAGTYYAWFRVFSGSERDTFPADGRSLSIVISEAA